MSVEHHELAEAYLRKLVEEGMHKRYDERCGGIPQEVIDRVEMEYQTIIPNRARLNRPRPRIPLTR